MSRKDTSTPHASDVEAGAVEEKPDDPGCLSSSTATNPAGAELADSKYQVTWEQPADQDPENPMTWSDGRKWANIGVLSFITFLTPLASSMLAPGVTLVMQEFKTGNEQVATFVVSIFVLGFALGPLVIAPLSELYGRVIVYNVCNALFTVFTIACAVSNSVGMLIAFRFLAGFAGVATLTCGSGTIADLMPPEKRGGAMAIWALGPLLGPVVGPVCAGYLVEAKGWRWVFWIITIFAGAVTIVSFVVLRETYSPVLLERKAARLRKETGDPRFRSALDDNKQPKEIFIASIVRPGRMFIYSPVVMLACVYIAVLYGLLYILFTTFAFVYRDTYGFSPTGAGLSFIAGGVGNIIGLLWVGILSDKLVKRQQASGKAVTPETRLSLIMTLPAALTLPMGLIMYGWTADKHVHWIAPMIGTGIMGFGMIGILMCIQTYLVDAYTRYAASATAANAVLRSLLGALLPLGGLNLYNSMGIGWGNTLLGLIALALAPIPIIFVKYGEKLRTKARQDF